VSGTLSTIAALAITRIALQAYHERLQRDVWPYAAVQRQWLIEMEREARRRVATNRRMAGQVRPV
jgi:hypothetical protein